jgi:hypothetical protein
VRRGLNSWGDWMKSYMTSGIWLDFIDFIKLRVDCYEIYRTALTCFNAFNSVYPNFTSFMSLDLSILSHYRLPHHTIATTQSTTLAHFPSRAALTSLTMASSTFLVLLTSSLSNQVKEKTQHLEMTVKALTAK